MGLTCLLDQLTHLCMQIHLADGCSMPYHHPIRSNYPSAISRCLREVQTSSDNVPKLSDKTWAMRVLNVGMLRRKDVGRSGRMAWLRNCMRPAESRTAKKRLDGNPAQVAEKKTRIFQPFPCSKSNVKTLYGR